MGGMHALEKIFGALPEEFPVPIVVVQHRYRTSSEALPDFLRRHSKLNVVDATDKQWIQPGHVYLAPANYHLLVERGRGAESLRRRRGRVLASVDRRALRVRGGRVRRARRSASCSPARTPTARAARSGSRSAAASSIVQDPKTAEAPEMPQAAIAATRVDRILPLDRIGPFLVELCRNSRDDGRSRQHPAGRRPAEQPPRAGVDPRARWGRTSSRASRAPRRCGICCRWTSRSCCSTCRCPTSTASRPRT